jgi:streptogramin lyase
VSHLKRRHFVLSLAVMGVCRSALAEYVPVRKRTVTKLFKAPEGHPNALSATPQGLWSADQVSDTAYLLDWKSGAVLKKVPTDSSNTSGVAFGGGYLWMGANGNPPFRKLQPRDSSTFRILKVDPTDGCTIGEFPTPDGGGIRGLLYADNSLWLTSFRWNTVTQLDPDTMEVKHTFPLQLPRAHGLAWDPPSIWVVYQDARLFMKQQITTGKVLDILCIQKDVDPVPHGIAVHEGKIYFCDAGLRASPLGDLPDNSPTAGYISTIDII